MKGEDFGEMFYKHTVFGNNTYLKNSKIGGMTHSARRDSCDCNIIQFTNKKPAITDSHINDVICEEFSMRNA